MSIRNILSAARIARNRTCRKKQPGRAVGAYDRTARPNALGTNTCRNHSVLDVFPMYHIVADNMPPPHHRARKPRTGRIVLIKDMVFTVVIEGRVRFVHPYTGRHCVELRAISVSLVLRAVNRYFFPIKGRVSAFCPLVIKSFHFVRRKTSVINSHLVQKSGRHLRIYAVFVLLCFRIAQIQGFFHTAYKT